jgi:hypothetical protein
MGEKPIHEKNFGKEFRKTATVLGHVLIMRSLFLFVFADEEFSSIFYCDVVSAQF